MPVLKHTLNNDSLPAPHEIAVGELVLALKDEQAVLYTKDFTGKVLEIGKGVQKFTELQDVNVTNAREGDFLVKQGNNFVAASQIGNLNRLSDVEINSPATGQYLRYDSLKEAYVNASPTYALSQLTDVDLTGLTTNQVLYFDTPSGKWKPRPRLNLVNQLDDVELTPTAGTELDPHRHQILSLDVNGTVWSNQDLQIVRDLNPTLGASLNANGNYFYNSFTNVGSVVANASTVNLPYATADYWIVTGVAVETQSQCILLPQISPATNQAAVMLIEIRQNTGQILIGGLTNVKYEDGKAIKLSGNGKTDIITVLVQNINGTITTYVTATALNLAALGQGGIPAWRYGISDNQTQLLAAPKLYDDYFKYVKLLLDFEAQTWRSKLWYEDKSSLSVPVAILGVTQQDTDITTFGIPNKIAEFDNSIDTITITPVSTINITADFTFEFYLQYQDTAFYESATSITHKYFDSTNFKINYTGQLTTSTQNLTLTLVIGTNTYTFENANRLFRYQNSRYIFFSVTRVGTSIKVHCDGQLLTEKTGFAVDSPVTNLAISSATISMIGRLDSVRLTVGKGRYSDAVYQPPAMRFGRLGGLEDVVHSQSFNYFHRSIGNQIFS
ncbi:botulinum neurotoxin type B [Pseudanabaena phage Pam2]|nr:botulinum neurotoxin type B [Pseudanabaena phage Pam2]